MNEMRALTSVRGIAAWLVVLYHIRGGIAGLPAGIEAVFAKGYLAVDFFFLLSGFVIWLTWHERLARPEPATVARFLRKRIARIWPLHGAMLAFAVALGLVLRATGRSDPAFPFGELPLHLMLVQNWGFTDALRWNDPAWSISCELAAYLAFPLLVAAVDWRRWPVWALLGVAAGLLLALHAVMAGQRSLGADIPRFGLVRCLIEFATGTMLAALFLRRPNTWRPLGAGLVLVGAWAAGAPETLVVPAAFAAALLALALSSGRPGHPLEGRMLHALGEASYATYLSHFLLWKAFRLPLPAGALGIGWVVAYLGVVLVASFALYHGLERPAQRWVNGWRWRGVRVAAAE